MFAVYHETNVIANLLLIPYFLELTSGSVLDNSSFVSEYLNTQGTHFLCVASQKLLARDWRNRRGFLDIYLPLGVKSIGQVNHDSY